ncbi:PREDICTED: GRAM domain-containing protein 1B-like [Priapulus caudatus]|uniref:GRAM domain-containing protein 1B-like n=1 Tax=Priapulus caudatus TaxID=37621 RepID=A0ABM1F0K7_PRICU|nr:PREDICTED: GRAM domain-containing protein 1B-like [Priapulus caudatus]
MMLFRIWQNSLLDQPMSPQDLWYWIHKNYGGDLGLTTEDEDYVEPSSNIPGTQYLIHTDDYDSSSCDTHSISDSDTLKHAKKRQRRKSAAVYAQHLNVDEVTIKKSFSVPDIVVKVALETKGTEKNNNTKSPAKGGKTKSSKNDTSQKNEPVKVQKNRTHSNDSTDSSSEGEDSGDGSDDDDGPTSCTCDNHNGYKPMDIDLDISAKQVYESIFTDSPCIRDFHVSKKMFDIDIEEWMLQEDGKQHRTLTYNLPVKTTLGDKIAHTKDNQVY